MRNQLKGEERFESSKVVNSSMRKESGRGRGTMDWVHVSYGAAAACIRTSGSHFKWCLSLVFADRSGCPPALHTLLVHISLSVQLRYLKYGTIERGLFFAPQFALKLGENRRRRKRQGGPNRLLAGHPLKYRAPPPISFKGGSLASSKLLVGSPYPPLVGL
jgi:hypothetical protein